MSGRREVIEVLGRLAFATELLERPDAESKRWSAAAWAIRSLEGSIEALAAEGRLGTIRGVEPEAVPVIEKIIAGQIPAELVAFERLIPAGLFELRELKGLGPKKTRALWRDLGVTTIGELEYAIRENRLLELSGFGPKTQQNLVEAIEAHRAHEGRVRLDQARALASRIERVVGAASLAGAARRGVEEVDRVDLVLVPPADFDEKRAALGLVAGRLSGVEIVFHACTPESFGPALVFATGSEVHVDALVSRAQSSGLELRADGLFEGGARRACPTEDALYEALGLHVTPPEQRESPVLVQRAQARPRLIERKDLRGAIHNHTTASDGRDSIEAMRTAAERHGLEYLAITEHSQTAGYAGGLDVARLGEQWAKIRALNATPGTTLLHGIESDILADGALDYDVEVLAKLEVVVASVHHRHSQDRAAMTARVVGAASNPWTDIIGHPTGRLLLGARKPADYDMDAFLAACAKNGVVVELNSSAQRLDLGPENLRAAKERGILVSISADAHSADELAVLDLGIAVARRAGLTPEDVLNTRPLAEVLDWLKARKVRAAAT